MRLSSSVAGPHVRVSCILLSSLTALLGACSTASGPGSMTTASLPPRPAEGLLQKPRSPFAPPSTIGAPPPSPSAHYQWNGNRDRVQTGTPETAAVTVPAPANVTWKATPRTANVSTRVPATAIQTRAAGDIIVGPGDTLYGLASRHHVTVASLMQANNLAGPAIAVNQHLKLPAASR